MVVTLGLRSELLHFPRATAKAKTTLSEKAATPWAVERAAPSPVGGHGRRDDRHDLPEDRPGHHEDNPEQRDDRPEDREAPPDQRVDDPGNRDDRNDMREESLGHREDGTERREDDVVAAWMVLRAPKADPPCMDHPGR